MLEKDPALRATLDEVRAHAWLACATPLGGGDAS
jgi:hypothetical protein